MPSMQLAQGKMYILDADPISSVGPNRRKVDGVSPLQPMSAIVKVYHSEG